MATTIERLPQLGDRVEVRRYHEFGEVKRVDLADCFTGEPTFFVRLDDGFGAWFSAPELRICGGAPASDPARYC